MDRRDPERAGDAHRLFFALWPGAGLRGAMRDTVDRVEGLRDGGRLTDPSKYHLTLHFLGAWATMPGDVVERCRRAAAAVDCGAFHLVIDHAGAFARARVGWLAPSGNSGLDALWSALGHALDDAGVPHRDGTRFSPHVTVVRGLAERLDETPVPALSWPVEDFVLVHSHAGHYEVIDRWRLRAAG